MEGNGRLTEEFRVRTRRFAALAIRHFVALPKNREEIRIWGRQMLRSGTSVAAHVREASRARSDAEFISKLGGALQEADETILWHELLREECGAGANESLSLEAEASAYVQTIEKRTSTKVGCLEEAAYRSGFLNIGQLEKIADAMPNYEYKSYLREVV